MPKVDVYKETGDKAGSIDLAAEIFAITSNEDLVHQAYVTHEANRRVHLAHAKIRSEKRGGGAKPWRQKGTGRARAGSRRSPIWVGGGVVFGPRKSKKFAKQMNVKAKRKALFMVLSDRVANKKLVVVDKYSYTKPETAKFAKMLDKLPMEDKTTLVVLPGRKNDKNIKLSARNIPGVGIIRADSLNIKDVLSYEYILLSKGGVDLVEKTFIKGAKNLAKSTKTEVKKTVRTKTKAATKKTGKKKVVSSSKK